ncbi:MAG: vitamin K epoxide reductase family protein [Acidobacteriota bacterium]
MFKRRYTVMALAALGVLDSLYIALTKYGCESCKTVHNTAWGHPFGLPIAYLGLLGYAAILAAVASRKHKAAYLMACCGVVISAILVYAQAFILHKFCTYCLISAGLMLAIWLVLFWMTAGWRGRHPILAASIAVLLAFTGWHWTSYEPVTVKADKVAIEKPITRPVNQPQEPVASDLVVKQQIKQHSVNHKNEKPRSIDYADTNHIPVKVMVYADQLPKTETPTPSQLFKYYDSASNPVNVDVYQRDILFFSSGCDECEAELAKVAELPPDQRPLLVDTFIPVDTDQATEKAKVESKLSQSNLDPTTVLYDFDRINPVAGVPTWMNDGIER